MMKKYDIHIHLSGIGDNSNCYISPRMKKSIVFKLLFMLQKIKNNQLIDNQYIQILKKYVSTSELDAAVLLAMDAVIDNNGNVDWEKSHTYIPNDYLFKICHQFEKFLPGVSINPYRRDAVERLQEAIHQGAVALKWLPNLQHFNPSDKRCDPIYKILADNQLPLITHTGCEHTFPNVDNTLGDASLYKKALDKGVIIVMSHCGVTCPFHHKYDSSKKIFNLFKSYENVYADTSALCSFLKFYHLHKLDFLSFHNHFVHGSDYPIPSMASGYLFHLGFRKMFQLAQIKNPLEKDIFIKKAMNLPEDIFTNAEKILKERISYWKKRQTNY